VTGEAVMSRSLLPLCVSADGTTRPLNAAVEQVDTHTYTHNTHTHTHTHTHTYICMQMHARTHQADRPKQTTAQHVSMFPAVSYPGASSVSAAEEGSLRMNMRIDRCDRSLNCFMRAEDRAQGACPLGGGSSPFSSEQHDTTDEGLHTCNFLLRRWLVVVITTSSCWQQRQNSDIL